MTSPELSGWLLTYLVHSTLLLGAAFFLAPRFKSHRIREVLWKTTLFGGFITATGQSLLQLTPLAGKVTVATERTVRPVETKRSAEPVPADTRSVEHSVGSVESVGSSSGRPDIFASREQMLVVSWALMAACLLCVYLARRVRFARRIAARRGVSESAIGVMLADLCSAAGITRRVRLTASTRLPSPVALGRSEIAVPEAALPRLVAGLKRRKVPYAAVIGEVVAGEAGHITGLL